MPDQTITRNEIIVVDKVANNQYGDLTFTDKSGKSYKVSNKRVSYFKDVIVEGMAVQLNYAMSSFGKEYIYSAAQVKDNLPPPQKPQEPIQKTTVIAGPTSGEKPKPQYDREKSIARMNGLNNACLLISTGMYPADSVGLLASQFERYSLGELDATKLDTNLKQILK
jgi:hypothetical protein